MEKKIGSELANEIEMKKIYEQPQIEIIEIEIEGVIAARMERYGDEGLAF